MRNGSYLACRILSIWQFYVNMARKHFYTISSNSYANGFCQFIVIITPYDCFIVSSWLVQKNLCFHKRGVLQLYYKLHVYRNITHFLFQYPEFLTDCVILSVSSACGQLFIFKTISNFGPIVFTMIMTIRQVKY